MDVETTQVGSMIVSDKYVAPSTAAKRVAESFFNEASLDALAVVDGGEPIGLITRNKLLFSLFRRYGFELYGKKPIITIADVSPLIIDDNERIDVTLDKALSRPPQDIYDEIVVIGSSGCYKGLLSVKQLIIQQSNSLANSMVQKELATERAKELEKISQVKSQFIANVTHELRSPVNVIIALAELMRISSEKGYVDQLRDRLALLISSATNLRAIITNILDLSKIEAGKMEVIYECFNLTEVLREVGETTRVLLGNKPVEVEVIADSGNHFVVLDPIKVRQILTNLMSNAAKFTDEGSIVLSLSAEKDRIRISVSDTGIGIKEQDLDKLFNAFSQLEDAKTKKHEGTGLGLTITKNLLDLLGGDIKVSSRFGHGTTFEITLPLTHSDTEE
jgi:signal transduction histidine kinase